jgi:hypothetical protein
MKNNQKPEKKNALKREVKALRKMIRALKQQFKSVELENEALGLAIEALNREKEAYKQKYKLENTDYKPLKKEHEALKLKNQALLDKHRLLKTEYKITKPKTGVRKKMVISKSINDELMNIVINEVKVKMSHSFPSNDIPKRLTKELCLIANRGSFTTFEIREKYKISRPTAQRDIKYLRECGLIKLKAGKSKGVFILTEEGMIFMKDYVVGPVI